jgi:biopolymer transport protein ExbB
LVLYVTNYYFLENKELQGKIMVELFSKGGPLMYPLLLGSIVMVAVVVERAYHFFRARVKKRLIENVRNYIEEGRLEEARALASESSGPVAAIVSLAIGLRKYTQEAIENELSIRGDQELGRLNRNLHLLELIGKTAPMIGLLGTVLGMVEAFREVASVTGLVNPSLLASGIWEALITTVAGLFVGIPALIFHHLFVMKGKSIAFLMKHYGEEIISMTRGRA